jgi:hypothetical protein
MPRPAPAWLLVLAGCPLGGPIALDDSATIENTADTLLVRNLLRARDPTCRS